QEQQTAREQAAWWMDYANLKFVFNNDADAEIRVAFDPDDGAWAYIGTDCRHIPPTEATMNLGCLDDGPAAHEFGHAIGLGHEHQNPAGGIEWNVQKGIQACAGAPTFGGEETRV